MPAICQRNWYDADVRLSLSASQPPGLSSSLVQQPQSLDAATGCAAEIFRDAG